LLGDIGRSPEIALSRRQGALSDGLPVVNLPNRFPARTDTNIGIRKKFALWRFVKLVEDVTGLLRSNSDLLISEQRLRGPKHCPALRLLELKTSGQRRQRTHWLLLKLKTRRQRRQRLRGLLKARPLVVRLETSPLVGLRCYGYPIIVELVKDVGRAKRALGPRSRHWCRRV
jgi:hypothetical protein